MRSFYLLLLLALWGSALLVTADAACMLPPFTPSGQGNKDKLRQGQQNKETCSNSKTAVNRCCPGFLCDSKTKTCASEYEYQTKGFQDAVPADLAVTAHMALQQVDAFSRGLIDTMQRATEAIAITNQQFDLMNYMDAADGEGRLMDTTDKASLDKEYAEKAKKFWKRLNETLTGEVDQFKQFANKTNTDFKDYFKGMGDDLKRSLKKPKGSKDEKPASGQPAGFDYQKYIPGGASAVASKGATGTGGQPAGFDWQQFVPKGVNVSANQPSAGKDQKKTSGKKDRETDATEAGADEYEVDSNAVSDAATGFDWSVYIPSGSSNKSTGDSSMGSTGQFDWSQFVPNTSKGGDSQQEKPSDEDKEPPAKKGHGKRLLKSTTDTGSGGFDYAQYMPKGVAAGNKDNQSGDLFAKHLAANYQILSAYFNSPASLAQDGTETDEDIERLKAFLLANTKNVSKKAEMVANEAAEVAEALSIKLRVAAANLKEAAAGLGKKVDNHAAQKGVNAYANVQATKPERSVGMGKYFLITLLIAFLGFSVIALFNRKRHGYSHL